jgi:response regulator RpfG family c-di-GMP phosphodiesterase
MLKVIIITDNHILNELLNINLVGNLGVELINLKNASEYLVFTDPLPNTDLIICQKNIAEEDSADIIQKHIADKQRETKLLVIDSKQQDPQSWKKIIESATQLLAATPAILLSDITPDYIPVPIKYFENISEVNCEVSIRIKKTPSEYQFVKRFHKGDSVSLDAINHYKDLGLTHFYIPKEQHREFMDSLSRTLVEKLDSPNLEMTEQLQIMGESYEIASKEIINLGFSNEIVKLTDSIIHHMIKNVETSPAMTGLLHKVINAQTPLAFQRCHMTTAIATECLKNLKLDTAESILNITFAAFFHDIQLIDFVDLAIINSKADLAAANITESERDLLLNHAIEAASLIYKYPNVPKGVEELIMQHHGVNLGLGFSIDIDSLPTLSKVFIIAHDFVLELLKYKENKTVPHSLSADLHKRFPKRSCTKIINALEQSLNKKKVNYV